MWTTYRLTSHDQGPSARRKQTRNTGEKTLPQSWLSVHLVSVQPNGLPGQWICQCSMLRDLVESVYNRPWTLFLHAWLAPWSTPLPTPVCEDEGSWQKIPMQGICSSKTFMSAICCCRSSSESYKLYKCLSKL